MIVRSLLPRSNESLAKIVAHEQQASNRNAHNLSSAAEVDFRWERRCNFTEKIGAVVNTVERNNSLKGIIYKTANRL